MKQSEAKRTILMLATQLAAAKHRARVANLDLKMMVETVKELDAVNREQELELRAYRDEEANRKTDEAIAATETAAGAMSFGQAVELMARRPGLELVDNEGDLWRVNGMELQGALGGRPNPLWVPRGISNEWNLLTFHIGTIQSVLTAS